MNCTLEERDGKLYCTQCNQPPIKLKFRGAARACCNVEARPKPPEFGPGTELEKLITPLGFPMEGCQSCHALAVKMNTWGVEGCREHREYIADELRAKLKAQDKTDVVLATLRSLNPFGGIGWKVDLADVAGSLVDEAIRLAALSVAADAQPGVDQHDQEQAA